METGRINLLNWFIEFAYIDLGKIGRRKIIWKAMEIQEILENGLWHDDVFSETLELANWRISSDNNLHTNIKNMKKMQKKFRESFEATMMTIKGMQNFENLQWVRYEDLKDNIPFESRPNVNIQADVCILPIIEHKEAKKEYLYKWSPKWPNESFFRIRSKVDIWSGEMLLMIFYRVLNGVQIGCLRECKECTKWFLHVTKRERIYCSNRCAARKANRDRRSRLKKTKPKEYGKELESNADRARKSYEKKIRSIHPAAKVQRRPRKYKKQDNQI
ncbi:hypothetical protein ACFL7M_13590 [Thermodesulfobacteriota bacterium]